MKTHRLTVANIGTDSSKFLQNIRNYIDIQPERVSQIYVDPIIFEYFTLYNHFSFDGETMYMWDSLSQLITLKRDPPEDRLSTKTRHIIKHTDSTGYVGDYVNNHIINYINKQPSYVEKVFVDLEIYTICRYNYSNDLVRSFDNSKMWVKKSRWGRVPVLKLPDNLAILI